MIGRAQNKTYKTKAPATLSPALALLQRKRVCSSTSDFTGDFEGCGRNRLLGLQPKLRISSPGDHYEQEADRNADQVMRMEEPSVDQRRSLRVQRLATGTIGPLTAPSIVNDALQSPGQPLDPATRAFFEPRFGHDFSNVRVHADERAFETAQEMNALAYTVGQKVVFGIGHYVPSTFEGQSLLAHELAHTIQQDGLRNFVQRQPVADRNVKSCRTVNTVIDLLENKARLLKQQETTKAPNKFTYLRDHLAESLEMDFAWLRYARGILGTELGDDRVLTSQLEKAYSDNIGSKLRIAAKMQGRHEYDLFWDHKDSIDNCFHPPRPRFDAQDQAALPALQSAFDETARTDHEYCAMVFRNTQNNSYHVSGLRTQGLEFDCRAVAQFNEGVEERVAYLHSHTQRGGDYFSDSGVGGRTTGDIEIFQSELIDGYLVNYRGEVLRYTHATERSGRGTVRRLGKLRRSLQ